MAPAIKKISTILNEDKRSGVLKTIKAIIPIPIAIRSRIEDIWYDMPRRLSVFDEIAFFENNTSVIIISTMEMIAIISQGEYPQSAIISQIPVVNVTNTPRDPTFLKIFTCSKANSSVFVVSDFLKAVT